MKQKQNKIKGIQNKETKIEEINQNDSIKSELSDVTMCIK